MKSPRGAFSVKRVVLNPRAYLRAFTICVLAHHVPLIVAFAAITRPSGHNECYRLDGLFDWLLASFALHTATAGLMIASIVVTLCQPVYRLRRPEVRSYVDMSLATATAGVLTSRCLLYESERTHSPHHGAVHREPRVDDLRRSQLPY